MINNKPYPSILQGFLLILIAIFFAGVFAIAEMLLLKIAGINKSDYLGVITMLEYIFTMLPIIVIARILRKQSGLTGPLSYQPFSPVVLVLGLIAVLSMGYTLELFQYYVPVTESFRKLMEEAMTNDAFSIITAVVLAPVLEEILMRGIILDGFLKRYSPSRSIIWSAVIFGVFHLNPWQAVAGIAAGIILGWLYWKTRSLLLCMILHAANNGIATLQSFVIDTETNPTLIDYMGMTYYIIGFVVAVILLIGCMRALNNHFKKRQDVSEGALPM